MRDTNARKELAQNSEAPRAEFEEFFEDVHAIVAELIAPAVGMTPSR
jgi:hypothetical protein